MGVVKNLVALIAMEVVAIFLLSWLLKYLFKINIFDFSTPRGKMFGYAIVAVFLYTFYSMLFDQGAIQELGASAQYKPSDNRRFIATNPVKPIL